MSDSHPFSRLTPDFVLQAVEAQGHACDGRLLALNSYENRVYQVGRHDAEPLIAKFYRPDRWSDPALEEEHAFCLELAAHDLPVVAPLADAAGQTVIKFEDFRIALYPRRGGRAPDFDNVKNLGIMGRYLARMHTVGGGKPFVCRPALSLAEHGYESVAYVSDGRIPADLYDAYTSLTTDLLQVMTARFENVEGIRMIRVHGDCHAGNVLWRDERPHFVDFDDARMAPAVQDLWMLLSGYPEEQRTQLDAVLDGYEEFAEFDYRELALIESLRTLRMLHYAAWLARRWQDPAFPLAFPWFNTQNYWERHILELREQLSALNEAFEAQSTLY